jgi:AraC-like DNA-binding protein
MASQTLRAPSASDTVPCSYALNLVALVARWAIAPEELLEGSSLVVQQLEEPSGRIPLTTMNALVARARDLTGEPGLGFYLGVQKRISMYGFLGLAMMSASNVRECLELAVRYTPVLTSAVDLRLCSDAGVASLVIEERIDMGDVHDVATLTLVVGLAHLGTALTGRTIPAAVDLALPEPSYYARFAHLMPRARFDQLATRVVFDAAVLDLPLVIADPGALRLARAECDRALDSLGFDAQLGGRVRKALVNGDRFRTFDEVAAALHVSRRTLARRLESQGLSFSALVETERRDRAMALLESPDVSLDDVTEASRAVCSASDRGVSRWRSSPGPSATFVTWDSSSACEGRGSPGWTRRCTRPWPSRSGSHRPRRRPPDARSLRAHSTRADRRDVAPRSIAALAPRSRPVTQLTNTHERRSRSTWPTSQRTPSALPVLALTTVASGQGASKGNSPSALTMTPGGCTRMSRTVFIATLLTGSASS